MYLPSWVHVAYLRPGDHDVSSSERCETQAPTAALDDTYLSVNSNKPSNAKPFAGWWTKTDQDAVPWTHWSYRTAPRRLGLEENKVSRFAKSSSNFNFKLVCSRCGTVTMRGCEQHADFLSSDQC